MTSFLLTLAAVLLFATSVDARERLEAPRASKPAVYPNPTGTGSMVTVSFPAGAESLELVLFDPIGRRIATAYRSEHPFAPGIFQVAVDGFDVDTGERIPAGYYFLCALSGGRLIGSVKLVLGR